MVGLGMLCLDLQLFCPLGHCMASERNLNNITMQEQVLEQVLFKVLNVSLS